jgi:hypothetical protein
MVDLVFSFQKAGVTSVKSQTWDIYLATALEKLIEDIFLEPGLTEILNVSNSRRRSYIQIFSLENK